VNTLGDYVEALGGRIEVRAVLPDRTVSLTQFFRKKPVVARTRKKTNPRRAGGNLKSKTPPLKGVKDGAPSDLVS
jgi:hypothetical protein